MCEERIVFTRAWHGYVPGTGATVADQALLHPYPVQQHNSNPMRRLPLRWGAFNHVDAINAQPSQQLKHALQIRVFRET
jgi:hypothetical protein